MGWCHGCSVCVYKRMILGMCDDMPSATVSNVLSCSKIPIDAEDDIDLLKRHIKQNNGAFPENKEAHNEPFLSQDGKLLDDGDSPKHEYISYTSYNLYENQKSLSTCASENGHSNYADGSSNRSIPQLKPGLVISPVDLPVDIEGSNSRLSTVLEQMHLPLVYLPSTKQLVADKNSTSDAKSETGSHKSSASEGHDEIHSNSLDQNSNQSTSTETILNTEETDSVCESFKQTLIGANDTYSLGENDSLLRLKEPDQLTCSSFDLDPDIPRVLTNDSLLRTFNDASSLSSLSTYTDISISAASMDEGEGAGLCIDTGDGFMEINLHSRNSYERTKTNSQDSGFEDKGAKSKKKGLSAFLSR